MNSKLLITATLAMAMSSTAWAECVQLRDGVRKAKRTAALVFDGTTVSLDHVAADGTRTRIDPGANLLALAKPEDAYLRVYAATLKVHRVWKGKVSTETTVYFVPNVDGPVFDPGKRQVVFAQPLTEEMRRNIIDPRIPLGLPWVSPCSGVSSNDVQALKQLGRSRRPSLPPMPRSTGPAD